eukprot:2806263-Rhodomonas_salina.1
MSDTDLPHVGCTTDEKPILIDTGLRPSDSCNSLYRLPVQWNSNGSVLAVAGVLEKGGAKAADQRDFSQVSLR